MSTQTKLLYLLLPALLCAIPAAHADYMPGPLPISLQGVPIPPVPGLLDGASPIIRDRNMAIALGKALFWDTAVGSDGYACASCHFHAGADNRSKNQLAPGGTGSTLATGQSFQATAGGNAGGPNYTMQAADFPFHKLADPLNPGSALLFDSDDVMGSAGTFSGQFEAVIVNDFTQNTPPDSSDLCARAADPVFHVGALGARKVTTRNAPTVINAIFNYRSFWDGRANNLFNGSNNWGDRDPNAGVWIKTGNNISFQRLELINSSLASLATAPPLNTSEMSCNQRTFKDLGRKLLNRYALGSQIVHYQDSVLGELSNSYAWSNPAYLQNGLYYTYHDLVVQAFNPLYWSYYQAGPFGSPAGASPEAYSQMEANFSMFFGLSIQMYLSTLVSDQSPFDQSPRDGDGFPTGLGASAQNGLALFIANNCTNCHTGPNLTGASVAMNAALVASHPETFGLNSTNPISTSSSVVNRLQSNSGNNLVDTGFASNGVVTDGSDLGLAGIDAFGNPLAFSLQYLQYLAGNTAAVRDSAVAAVQPCNFQLPLALNMSSKSAVIFTQTDGVIPQTASTVGCITPTFAYQPSQSAMQTQLNTAGSRKTLAVAEGLFKIPSLRNVELTGPYMHNGSMSTLQQVVEFYSRGGNFQTAGLDFAGVFQNSTLGAFAQNRTDIINFLNTLTDNRVRYQQAPFDHPSLIISTGHPGNNAAITDVNPLSPNLGADQNQTLPAVGAQGITSPLQPFDHGLQ